MKTNQRTLTGCKITDCNKIPIKQNIIISYKIKSTLAFVITKTIPTNCCTIMKILVIYKFCFFSKISLWKAIMWVHIPHWSSKIFLEWGHWWWRVCIDMLVFHIEMEQEVLENGMSLSETYFVLVKSLSGFGFSTRTSKSYIYTLKIMFKWRRNWSLKYTH